MSWLKENWFKLGILFLIAVFGGLYFFQNSDSLSRLNFIKGKQGQVAGETLSPEKISTQETEIKKVNKPKSTNPSPVAPPNTVTNTTPAPAPTPIAVPTSNTQNDQLVKDVQSKFTAIQSSMSTLTQLQNNCDKAIADADAEIKRLTPLLSGDDYLGTLDKISVQRSYEQGVLQECASKQIAIIDNLLVELRAMLRIQNLPVEFSNLSNQLIDALVLKRQRVVDWQYQSRL